MGISLLEIMIGLTIAMFMMAGLFTLFSGTRTSNLTQTNMAQLQDNERMAASILASVVQQAGYYALPQNYTLAQALPVTTTTWTVAGQGIYGTSSGNHTDTLSVRFLADRSGGTDNLLNCDGSSNGTANTTTFVNTFTLVPSTSVNGTTTYDLSCSVNGATPVALVGGISTMDILYGVDTQNAGTVRRYYTGTGMNPVRWGQVRSVQITLGFVNPLYIAGQDSASKQIIPFTQVISLMSKS
jgi:type IV pilus assembly protein PilW